MQPIMDRATGDQVNAHGQCERNRSNIYTGTCVVIGNGENYSSNPWQNQDARWADNYRQSHRTDSVYRGNIYRAN